MATTSQTYNGDGSTAFTFNVPVMQYSDVKASIGGVETTAFTVSGPYATPIVTFTPAPPTGTGNIEIRRETNNDSIQANFQSGSALRASDFNDNFTQFQYVTQEAQNQSDLALTNSREGDSNVGFKSAITVANEAKTTATAANTAVSAALPYAVVANNAALNALTPSNGSRVEVQDSSNLQNNGNVAGLPSTFTGAAGLFVRLEYLSSNSKWNFVDYRSTDPDNRYLNAVGNVGINNNNTPQTTLSFGTGSVIGLDTSDGSDGGYLYIAGGGGNSTDRGSVITLTGNELPLAGSVNISAGTGGGTDSTAGSIFLSTGATTTPRLSVAGDGKVGIGTLTPGTKLEVNGTITANAISLSTPVNINGVAFDGSADINVGRLPQRSYSSAFSLSKNDAGHHIKVYLGDVTVPKDIFSIGDVVSIYNSGSANRLIKYTNSTTLRLAGTSLTGQRTLASKGFCTILCVNTNDFIIFGYGLS